MKKKRKDPKKESNRLTMKAGMAMKNGFYLEASWIISGIMELKFKKLLTQAEGRNPGAGFTLEQFLKRIKYLIVNQKDPGIGSFFTIDLIDKIRSWKNQRNTIMKDMLFSHVSASRKERLAKDGVALLKQFNGAYKNAKSLWKPARLTVPAAEE